MSVIYRRASSVMLLFALLGLPSAGGAGDYDKFTHRMKKLGLSMPGWFLMPNIPPSEGDGRPETPLAETVSSMHLVTVGADGKPTACEVLMTNGPDDLAEGYCRKSMEAAHFETSARGYHKAFWIHSHQDPNTGNVHANLVDLPVKN